MAITNHERIGKALELLKAGLGPFVEREMKSTYGDEAQKQVGRFMGADRLPADKPVDQWDVAALLTWRRTRSLSWFWEPCGAP